MTNILVGRKKIEWIAYNHKLSAHAKMQMVRRAILVGNMTGMILNSPLSWKLPDNYIAIALNLYEYIVVGMRIEEKSEPTIVTYISLKGEQQTVIDKMLIAYQDAIRGGNSHD